MEEYFGIPVTNYWEEKPIERKPKKVKKLKKEKKEKPKPLVFEFKEMKYYDSRGSLKDGSYENFINSISGQVAHVKCHMGGNYGAGDEYIVITESGDKFSMLYYGDDSANLTRL